MARKDESSKTKPGTQNAGTNQDRVRGSAAPSSNQGQKSADQSREAMRGSSPSEPRGARQGGRMPLPD